MLKIVKNNFSTYEALLWDEVQHKRICYFFLKQRSRKLTDYLLYLKYMNKCFILISWAPGRSIWTRKSWIKWKERNLANSNQPLSHGCTIRHPRVLFLQWGNVAMLLTRQKLSFGAEKHVNQFNFYHRININHL